MVYIHLACIIVSSFIAGWCFSVDLIAAGAINVLAVVLNAIVVTLYLED